MYNECIKKLTNSISASSVQYRELDKVIAFLRTEIQPRVRASSVHAFGSACNGLWTSASDADLTLIVPRCNNKGKILTKLRVVREYVWKMGGDFPVKSIDLVENARIPILKLATRSPILPEIDLSINNISGIENSLLVREWTRFDSRFIPVAMAVKHWARSRKINDRARGTLSTYTLLLQLVFVMQQHSMLPLFVDFGNLKLVESPFDELNGVLRETPFNTSFSFNSKSELSVSELFELFFKTFGDDEMKNGAEIVDGTIITKPSASGALIMRCPLTGKDVNVMTASAWKNIHAEFARTTDMISQKTQLDSILNA